MIEREREREREREEGERGYVTVFEIEKRGKYKRWRVKREGEKERGRRRVKEAM